MEKESVSEAVFFLSDLIMPLPLVQELYELNVKETMLLETINKVLSDGDGIPNLLDYK